MSLHLLLVANWTISLVYEDNDFRHASIHFFEAIKPFSAPLTGLEETSNISEAKRPGFLLLTTIKLSRSPTFRRSTLNSTRPLFNSNRSKPNLQQQMRSSSRWKLNSPTKSAKSNH